MLWYFGLTGWCHYQSCPLKSTSTSEVEISQLKVKISSLVCWKSLAKQKLRLQTVYVINSAIFKSLEIHWWVKLLRYDAKGYKSNSYPKSSADDLIICVRTGSVINYVMILLTWCIGIWFNSCLLLCNTVCNICSNNFWCQSILKFYPF